MNRLTWKRSLDGHEDVGLRDGVTISDAICRLADYEESGLEPEEIMELRRQRREAEKGCCAVR